MRWEKGRLGVGENFSQSAQHSYPLDCRPLLVNDIEKLMKLQYLISWIMISGSAVAVIDYLRLEVDEIIIIVRNIRKLSQLRIQVNNLLEFSVR